jgi:hypothetical protein
VLAAYRQPRGLPASGFSVSARCRYTLFDFTDTTAGGA